MKFRPPTAQRGLALIVAMLVAALAAAVAMSLASSQSQWLAQVQARRDQVQAQSIAQAGVQWARQILDADAHAGTIDDLREPWALPLPATPLENGSVEGGIIDAQGLFNVNNLASVAHGAGERQRFAKLFASLGLPPALLDALVDWAVAANRAQAGSADGAAAASAAPARIEELAGVKGMTSIALATLVPRLASLPIDTQLNVNTAAPELLAASVTNLGSGALATLIASRTEKPFTSIADFRARLPAGASIGDETMYSVASRYFLVTVRARQGETSAQARALVDRIAGASPAVDWETVE